MKIHTPKGIVERELTIKELTKVSILESSKPVKNSYFIHTTKGIIQKIINITKPPINIVKKILGL